MSNQSQSKWYDKIWLVILLCIIFFPVGLFGLWKNSSLHKHFKIIVTAIIAIIFIVQLASNKSDEKTSKVNTNETPSNEVDNESKPTEIDLKTKIKNTIKSIDGGDDFTKSPMESAASFATVIGVYKAFVSIINEGKQSNDKEILKLTEELSKKVSTSQLKNFPKLRKAYFKFLKNSLWEHDIYVNLSGNKNTTLQFTGTYYAANKNIKDSQEALSEMLYLLRFKRTEYRWYKESDEYTYYTLDSSKDSELIE